MHDAAVIRDFHGADKESYQVNDWDLANAGPLLLPAAANPRVRVRASRSFAAFPLMGAMAEEDRVACERALLPALKDLCEDPAFGGRVYSLTPHGVFGLGGNPNLVTRDQPVETKQDLQEH